MRFSYSILVLLICLHFLFYKVDFVPISPFLTECLCTQHFPYRKRKFFSCLDTTECSISFIVLVAFLIFSGHLFVRPRFFSLELVFWSQVAFPVGCDFLSPGCPFIATPRCHWECSESSFTFCFCQWPQ